MNLNEFLNLGELQGTFPSFLSPRGGYITFRNSGQRGDYKFFQIGLDSLLITLSDIKRHIRNFQRIQNYNEREWRDAGSRYYTDNATNAMCTVQSKPLFATLSKIIMWANPEQYTGVNPEQRMILTEETLARAIEKLEILAESYRPTVALSPQPPKDLNLIFYGAPGTGKSKKAKEIISAHSYIRTTFHPDTDYASFVGCYKPSKKDDEITYSFIPQAFTKAYVAAWKSRNEPYYLLIEEINRGNCAQIFGDIFQLLDRRNDGYSEYTIDVDTDLADYLESQLSGNPEYIEKIAELSGVSDDYSKLALPNNLYIIATMNTSDQSLFPMDSAFKRRWAWEYIPINYTDADQFSIELDEDTLYSWGEFLRQINPKIKELTGNEDKQLGNRFINPHDQIITFDQFRSKVMFYLWFEIYKDEAGGTDTIFKKSAETEFSFTDLFVGNKEAEKAILKEFFSYNGINPKTETEEVLVAPAPEAAIE